jgi:hypothetical protein
MNRKAGVIALEVWQTIAFMNRARRSRHCKHGDLSRVQLPTCCEILLDFGIALTQSLRPIAYIAAMDERRVTVRDRVLRPGTIEFGGGAITCMVRNASRSHRPCQIIWRKRKRIGVEFD